MRRIFQRNTRMIDGKPTVTIEQIGWSKPGTAIDKAQRKIGGYLFDNYSGSRGKPSGRREVTRRLNQLPDDGHGRVRVAHYQNTIPNPYYLGA